MSIKSAVRASEGASELGEIFTHFLWGLPIRFLIVWLQYCHLSISTETHNSICTVRWGGVGWGVHGIQVKFNWINWITGRPIINSNRPNYAEAEQRIHVAARCWRCCTLLTLSTLIDLMIASRETLWEPPWDRVTDPATPPPQRALIDSLIYAFGKCRSLWCRWIN